MKLIMLVDFLVCLLLDLLRFRSPGGGGAAAAPESHQFSSTESDALFFLWRTMWIQLWASPFCQQNKIWYSVVRIFSLRPLLFVQHSCCLVLLVLAARPSVGCCSFGGQNATVLLLSLCTTHNTYSKYATSLEGRRAYTKDFSVAVFCSLSYLYLRGKLPLTLLLHFLCAFFFSLPPSLLCRLSQIRWEGVTR